MVRKLLCPEKWLICSCFYHRTLCSQVIALSGSLIGVKQEYQDAFGHTIDKIKYTLYVVIHARSFLLGCGFFIIIFIAFGYPGFECGDDEYDTVH